MRVSGNTQWLLKVLLRHDNLPTAYEPMTRASHLTKSNVTGVGMPIPPKGDTHCKAQELGIFGKKNISYYSVFLSFQLTFKL